MRFHRFYIDHTLRVGDQVFIQEERLLNQWLRVFRYTKGDRVIIFNGLGKEFLGELSDIEGKQGIYLKVLEEKEGIVPSKNITLYQSLVKKDNMEWIVEKATELGVSRIVPLISERSEKKGFNEERAKKIAIEASEQSRRIGIPSLGEVLSLEQTLRTATGEKIAFHTSPNPLLTNEREYQNISIFIGPEGGWTENEISLFVENGVQLLSLGPLILRAETAAIVALARLSF